MKNIQNVAIRLGFSICLLALCPITSAIAQDSAAGRGSFTRSQPTGWIDYRPAGTESQVPVQFQLPASRFSYQKIAKPNMPDSFEVYDVTFPSPIKTPHPLNNTVHCEYFLTTSPEAATAEKRPGVIVLHILGGDFPLARAFCSYLAQRGVATLFVKMPYYGPRRDPNSRVRMIQEGDPEQTVRGMRQAVLDVRRAAGWLAAQPEVDAEQLGIMGISLGGIVSALTASVEPRFDKAALLLAGGDFSQFPFDHPELAPLKKKWEAMGYDETKLIRLLKTVDPVTYAANLKGRKVIMLNARYDEIIPPPCTEALWQAAGKPPIEWWPTGHITAGLYMFQALDRVGTFFGETGSGDGS
ncbi:Abhydrolase domain-containing 18 [Planctomycetales bacterium 10988]|nr:Abhydrolase domain-containing 18 [Planctomycetales bacterium 10988]